MSKPQRLPSGRWRIQWFDHAGTRRSETFVTQATARAALRCREVERDEIRSGVKARPTSPAPAPPPLFSDFADEFMRTFVAANNKPSSRVAKERIFRTLLVPAFGTLRLHEVGLREIEAFKARLLADGYARTTGNNVLILLGHVLRYAKDVGILATVPAFRPFKVAAPAFDFLDFDEFDRLATAPVEGELAAMILVAGEAGLRSGEIRALTWDDVDLVARRITVRWGEYRGEVDSPKGGRHRTIDMTSRLVAALRGIRHLRGDRVFSGPAGELLTEKAMTCALWRACQRSGLRRIGWHTLRHTFCSHLTMRGATARAIMELAGHANIATTQRYMHLSPTSTRQAIDLLETGAPSLHTPTKTYTTT